MAWGIRITDEDKKDFNKIEGSVRKQILAGTVKVSKAPLPSPNGYGKPLGNKNGNNLTGFFRRKRKYKEQVVTDLMSCHQTAHTNCHRIA